MSNVSITWYTWLEQGRDINPSRQVLDAVARTLRLSPSEHAYILTLAGLSPAEVQTPTGRADAPEHVQRLLDAMVECPAFAIEPDWWISGWNAAYAKLYPNVAQIPASDRNLLWSIFTDPYVRKLLPNWETDSRRLLAEFRAEAGPRLDEPSHTSLIEKLLEASGTFRTGWEGRDIEGFASRERLFHHPRVGDLRLEHHQLAPLDQKDLNIVVYLPIDAQSSERLRRLLQADEEPESPNSVE